MCAQITWQPKPESPETPKQLYQCFPTLDLLAAQNGLSMSLPLPPLCYLIIIPPAFASLSLT